MADLNSPAVSRAPGVRGRRVVTLGVLLVLVAAAAAGTRFSLALFTDSESASTAFDTQTIFSGERVTAAFSIHDRSSGGSVDASSALAFPSDGRTITTAAAGTAFRNDRYLELALNRPLPGGLRITPASFTLRFASTESTASACYYIELRRTSTAAVIAVHGGPAAPLACVAGTGLVSSSTVLPALDTTDLANDLTIRVLVRDSAGAPLMLDEAVVSGSTVAAPFALYPVLFVDAADGTPSAAPWDLSGL